MNNLNYSKRQVSLLIINKRRVVAPSKTNKKIVKKNSTVILVYITFF